MTFAQAAARPISRKIVLLELDIGREWAQWFNRYAGTWYVNFDLLYPLIDSAFLAGAVGLEITRIGSVKVDGVSLSPVTGAVDVQINDSSFYFHDGSKTLYVHCPGGDEPRIHRMVIGEAYGICTQAAAENNGGVYNGFAYEPRLKSAPSISKRKDPLFFGKVAFTGGEVVIANEDGAFDLFGEDNDVFGNAARLLMGFDDLPYSEFRPIFSGYMDRIIVGRTEMRVAIQDLREQLSRELPPNVFDATTYPNIKDANVGKPIPLGYGTMRNAPVVCTNEDEAGPPLTFTFKLCDVADHAYGIKAIDAVYVNGVAKTPSASSLTAGTFSLATADYDPGDEVTCDWRGFVDPDGNLISNALDVLVDLLTTYYPISFNDNYFDMARWETAGTPDIGLFIGKSRKLIEVVEDICATVQGIFVVMDDGRFAHRIYSEHAPVRQTFDVHDLLEVPTVEYDPTEVLTSVRVGYNRDWSADEFYEYVDRNQEDAIFQRFKTYRTKAFETLLVDQAAAADFSEKILALSGDVKRTFELKTKTQAIERELGDIIECPVSRANGAFLGDVRAEVIGVDRDATGAVVSLECRLIERLAATEWVEAPYVGDELYGDEQYGVSMLREVG